MCMHRIRTEIHSERDTGTVQVRIRLADKFICVFHGSNALKKQIPGNLFRILYFGLHLHAILHRYGTLNYLKSLLEDTGFARLVESS